MNFRRSIIALCLAITSTAGCVTKPYPAVAVIYSTLSSDAEPPVVTIETRIAYPADGTGSGQAIVVGDLLLTAAHTQAEIFDARNRPNVVLFGQEVQSERVAAGLMPGTVIVNSTSQDGPTLSLDQFGQDWAIMRLRDPPGLPGGRMLAETGPLRKLTPVSVFRGSEDGRYRQRFDTYVLELVNADEFPSNLVFLAKPAGFDSEGWSGSFVGTWSRGEGAWRLIGVFVATPEGTLIETNETVEGLMVVRPPPELLEWFVQGGIGEPPVPAR